MNDNVCDAKKLKCSMSNDSEIGRKKDENSCGEFLQLATLMQVFVTLKAQSSNNASLDAVADNEK